LGSRNKYVSR